ncbi:MAG: helix-turn-helix transcriptional regulator [Hyphomonadaceae bacterium]
MFASASAQNLDCWMDAGLRGGDWRAPLDLSARMLGAQAMVMLCEDQAAGTSTASVCSGASIDFVLRCRELAAERASEPQRRFEAGLGYIGWASSDTGPVDRRLSVTVVGQFHGSPDELALQSVAAMAACSVGVKARLDAVQAASALKTAAFDQLPFGVAIVDEQIRTVEMNETCRSMIARGDGLSFAQGKLLCRDRADQAALARSVSAALRGETGPPIVRIVRAGGAEPYVARAICAGQGEEASLQCLLMIVDPDGGPPLASDLWRAMFDLTDCELIIAQGIVEGRKITDIACQRGVSVETVRTQTKRMFERLNVSSQVEAAARLSRVAPFRARWPV